MGKETAVAVAKTEAKALAVPEQLKGNWGGENISNSDILIPRLLLMQGLSELVTEGKFQQGDLVRSTTQRLIAKKGEGVEFLPLMSFKTWVISEHVGGKYEFRTEEPMTMENEAADREFDAKNRDGKDAHFRRDRAINVYILLKQDCERYEKARIAFDKSGELPSSEDALLPCLLSFRRTSYRAGRQLLTFFKSCEQFKVPPAAGTYKLTSAIEKNDKGVFHVFGVEQAGRTSLDHLALAKEWYNALQGGKVKVDDEKVTTDDAAAGAQVVSGHDEDF